MATLKIFNHEEVNPDGKTTHSSAYMFVCCLCFLLVVTVPFVVGFYYQDAMKGFATAVGFLVLWVASCVVTEFLAYKQRKKEHML